MGELQGENPGTRPGPLRWGHHHNLRLNFCITEHGWIGLGQAAARWRISFVWFARLFSHICFAAFFDAYFLSIPAIAYAV